jgi:hypothetical protein
MVKFNLLALTAALTGLSQAVGESKVTNNCDSSVYLWVVGSQQEGPFEIKPGKQWKEEYWRDDISGGIALKITKEDDGVPSGDAQIIFSYTLDPDRIWYDLSNTFGAPFEGEQVYLRGQGACPDIDWPEGVPPTVKSTFKKTVDCTPDMATNLLLCGI